LPRILDTPQFAAAAGEVICPSGQSFKTIKDNLFTGSEESTDVPLATNLLLTFKEYPSSQVDGSLSIEKELQMVQNGASGAGK
jgi:hypothetical protein